jgi:hypothetical protein
MVHKRFLSITIRRDRVASGFDPVTAPSTTQATDDNDKR